MLILQTVFSEPDGRRQKLEKHNLNVMCWPPTFDEKSTAFVSIAIIVPLFTLFFYINSFYNSNLNDLIDSQTQKIKNLESKNKLQSDKLDNYEFTIEKNINDNRQSLKALNNQLKENQKRSDKIVKVLFDTQGLSKETRKVGSGGKDSIKLPPNERDTTIPQQAVSSYLNYRQLYRLLLPPNQYIRFLLQL